MGNNASVNDGKNNFYSGAAEELIEVYDGISAIPEAIDYFRKLTVLPNLTIRRLINELFIDLVNANSFYKAELLYLPAIQNPNDGLMNIVNNRFNLITSSETPFFIPYLGYRSKGFGASYLKNGYVPLTNKNKISQNNVSFLVSEFGKVTDSDNFYGHGCRNVAGTAGIELVHDVAVNWSKGYLSASDNNITEVVGMPLHKSFGIIRRESGKTRKFTDQTFHNESAINSVSLPDTEMHFLASLRNAAVLFQVKHGIDYSALFSGLTDAEYIATDYAFRKYITNVQLLNEIVIFDGDSLTEGRNVTPINSYPEQLLNKIRLTTNNNFIYGGNFGVPNQMLSEMITAAPYRIDPLFNAAKRKNLIIWGGINDFGREPATSAADIYTRYKNYCIARKAAGFNVFALTMLPQQGYARANYEVERIWFNTQVTTDLILTVDGIIDVAADLRIGNAGCENNLIYFQADKLHLTDTGYSVVKDVAYPIIIPFLT